jgi:hypothetical protein
MIDVFDDNHPIVQDLLKRGWKVSAHVHLSPAGGPPRLSITATRCAGMSITGRSRRTWAEALDEVTSSTGRRRLSPPPANETTGAAIVVESGTPDQTTTRTAL